MSRAYVLLSGGIDSTTCLAIACKQFSGSVRGVSFNYGQRHTKEIEHARMVCESFGITHEVLSARGLIAKGGLTDEGLEMPNVSYDELPRGMSPTYVPSEMVPCLQYSQVMQQLMKNAKQSSLGPMPMMRLIGHILIALLNLSEEWQMPSTSEPTTKSDSTPP